MTINRTNTASTLESVIVGFDEVRGDVNALADILEHLVVLMKKQLGSDADRLLSRIDDVRESEETPIAQPFVRGSYENEMGAVFSDKRDSARED